MAKKTQEEEKRGEKVSSSGLKSHGPRSIYESDTNYQSLWIGGESFKETETGYSLLFWSFKRQESKKPASGTSLENNEIPLSVVKMLDIQCLTF